MLASPGAYAQFGAITQYGWERLGGRFGVTGNFFRVSLYDLLNGVSNISNLSFSDMIGAYDWWSDSTILSVTEAAWLQDRVFGYTDHASLETLSRSIEVIQGALAAGLIPNTILGWSPDQLAYLVSLNPSLPVDQRFDPGKYIGDVIQCLVGLGCAKFGATPALLEKIQTLLLMYQANRIGRQHA